MISSLKSNRSNRAPAVVQAGNARSDFLHHPGHCIVTLAIAGSLGHMSEAFRGAVTSGIFDIA